MHPIAGRHAHPVRPLSGGMLLWLMALLFPLVAIAAPAPISVCVDDGFAPFEYASHDNPRVPRGATTTLIQQILTRNKIAYRVAWYPWSRCLAYIKQGDIQLGMDTYFDAARAREVLYSEPYYTLTPQYYYSKRKYPGGLGIQDRDDLKKFRGCGVRGYSYAHYGLSDRDLESGALDDIQLVEKLARGHCDYFVEELEVMQGYALTGHPFLDNPDLGHGAVPGAAPPQMHFILARNSAVSVWLLPLLNREITLSNKQGTMRRLMDVILHHSPRARGE
jgi:polar amino acid transport system substrate-binding protein